MFRCHGWCYAFLSIAALSGCASRSPGGSGAERSDTASVTTGFRVFYGDCINSQPPNFHPALVPLLSNIVSGGLKAVGGVLKRYGEDTDARFATTLNFESGENVQGCLHVVHGPVFTDPTEFRASEHALQSVLPLPWREIARANLAPGATESEIQARVPSVVAAAKDVLVTSGAMLAAQPKFFAEMRIVRSPDSSNVAFRLRSFYYGEPLGNGWFTRRSAKAVVLTVSGFDASKSLIDSLKAGYSVAQSDVQVGKAWVTSDLLNPNGSGEGRNAWDSPWFTLPPDKKKPFTMVTGLLETTAGSKLLSVLGSALEGSADDTTKAIFEALDPKKQAEADATVKAAELKAKADAAIAVVKAVTEVGKAKDAHEACTTALTPAPATLAAVTKPQRDAFYAYVSARITAIATIAAAEPLFSTMDVPIGFIEEPGLCVLPI